MEVVPLALAPSLLWLWWFWKKEPRLRRESAHPLARAFVLGGAITVPAGLLSWFLEMFVFGQANTWRFFLVVGPVEELAKYLAARLAIRREPTYDEHSDGIVFAAAAALGFAFVENIYYFSSANPITIIMRCSLSVPMHVLSAVLWGEAMGRVRFVPGTSRSVLYNGLILAALFHGLFDSVASNATIMPTEVTYVLLVGLLVLQWRLYGQLLRHALSFKNPSPFEMVPAIDPISPVSIESTAPLKESEVPAVDPIVPTQNDKSIITGSDTTESARLQANNTQSESEANTTFDWAYVFKSICFALPSLVPIAIACAHSKGPGDFNFILAMSVIVSIGFMMGVWSPGCAIREVALGMALIGALAGAISWAQAIASALTLGLLGAFGAWLGESLQNQTRKCPQSAHSHKKTNS